MVSNKRKTHCNFNSFKSWERESENALVLVMKPCIGKGSWGWNPFPQNQTRWNFSSERISSYFIFSFCLFYLPKLHHSPALQSSPSSVLLLQEDSHFPPKVQILREPQTRMLLKDPFYCSIFGYITATVFKDGMNLSNWLPTTKRVVIKIWFTHQQSHQVKIRDLIKPILFSYTSFIMEKCSTYKTIHTILESL